MQCYFSQQCLGVSWQHTECGLGTLLCSGWTRMAVALPDALKEPTQIFHKAALKCD